MPHRIPDNARYPCNARVEVLSDSHSGVHLAALVDISRGGAFVLTEYEQPVGSLLYLHIHAPAAPVDGLVRVVRWVSAEEAARRHLVPGMGVEFKQVSPSARNALEHFVRTLERETYFPVNGPPAQWPQELAPGQAARFADRSRVVVEASDRAELELMWTRDVSRGGLFVETGSFRQVGSQVNVMLSTPDGVLTLRAEVVHTVTPEMSRECGLRAGAGLQFTDLEGIKQDALEEYLRGRAQRLADPPVMDPGLNEALAAARQLFDGVESRNIPAALGLSYLVTPERITDRAQELAALWQGRYPSASPGQRARMTHALEMLPGVARNAVAQLEVRRAREIVVHEPVQTTGTPAGRVEHVQKLLHEATEHRKRKDNARALRCLQAAHSLAPGDQDVEDQLDDMRVTVNRETARDLLRPAAMFAKTGSLSEQAVADVRKALELTSDATLVGQALVALATSGHDKEAVRQARLAVTRNPKLEVGWMVLGQLYEKHGDRLLAARAFERLNTLRPDHKGKKELNARIKRLRTAK